jgi:hypothetical protein
MSDTQEKKWRAYKKAVTIEEFTSNIIPVFTPSTTYDKTSPVYATDEKWGEWKVWSNKSTTYGPVFVVDGKDNTNMQSGYEVYWYAEAPEGISINPKQITLKYSNCAYPYGHICGWNPENPNEDKWELLRDIPFANKESTITYTAPEGSSTYYTKFRVYVPKFGDGRVLLYTFSIDKGTIKKG